MKKLLSLVIFALVLVMAGPAQAESLRDLMRDFKRAMATRDADKIATAVRNLAKANSKKSVQYLVGVALQSDRLGLPEEKTAKVFEAAVEGLRTITDQKAMEYLIKQAEKSSTRSWRINVMLIDVLKNNSSAEAKAAVVKNLKHRKQEVHLAAIRAVKETKNTKAVPSLIDLVEKTNRSQNLTWIESRRALLAITGQDFDTPSDWRKWWSTVKDNFNPSSSGGGSTSTVIRKRKKGPELFGTEVNSKRVVFILDVSGSMEQKDPETSEGGGGTYNPGNRPKGQGAIPEHRKRIIRAKNELIKVVKALDRDVRFNIITFSNKIKVWKDKYLYPATPGNKASAIKFIEGMRASGMTWTDHALKRAFKYKNANTFYLMSDGSPTHDGKTMLPTGPICDMVKAKNKFRRVTIFTMGFVGANTSFMQQLADENNGKYFDIR